MYTDKEFEFIDNLLRNSLNNDYTYEKLCYTKDFDYNLYEKLFTDINKEPYKLIELHETSFVITHLGRHVAINGFKNYLESIKTDQELDKSIKTLTLDDLKKSNSRSRNAFILSILAIIISVIFGILDYTKPEKSDNNVDNNSNNGKIQTDSTSQINHSQLKRDSINKTAIKVISDSSKH